MEQTDRVAARTLRSRTQPKPIKTLGHRELAVIANRRNQDSLAMDFSIL